MLQVCKGDEFCIHFPYVGLRFNHAELTLESGTFVHPMHTYFSPVFIFYSSLLMLNECWPVLSGSDSAVGLNVKKAELIIFPLGGYPLACRQFF